MKCEFCKGSGKLYPKTEGWPWIPCVECNGTGIADCCNGITKDAGCVDNEWPENPAEVETFR